MKNKWKKAAAAVVVTATLATGAYFTFVPCAIAGTCCCTTFTGNLCCRESIGSCLGFPLGCSCAF